MDRFIINLMVFAHGILHTSSSTLYTKRNSIGMLLGVAPIL